MNSLLNETFFKIFLVICLIPVAILVGKAFLLLSPILFWVLGYMAFKKGNQNETIMWVISVSYTHLTLPTIMPV